MLQMAEPGLLEETADVAAAPASPEPALSRPLGGFGFTAAGEDTEPLAPFGPFRIKAQLHPDPYVQSYRAERDGQEVRLRVETQRRPGDKRRAHAWLKEEAACAEALADLEGLPCALDHGEIDGRAYVAYRWVEGTLLSQMVLRKRPPLPAALGLAAGVAEDLHAAHERGFLICAVASRHIRIKADGRPVLDELGFVARHEGPLHPRLPYQIFSLAPEFIAQQRYDARSEQFALAAVLYELLTGTRPFRGLEDRVVAYQILHRQPLAPSVMEPSVPGPVSDIVMRALEKDPGDRFADCAAFAEALLSEI